jgi:ribosome biogenesis GTPase
MQDSLELLGFRPSFQSAMEDNGWCHLDPGRVVEAHLGQYVVRTTRGPRRAEISGKLRFSLEARDDFPTVGDWVALAVLDDELAIIHHLLPRETALSRRAASQDSARQVIGANIDIALVVQAVERDFNLNRLERYLAAAHGGGIEPVVVLSKIDLLEADELAALVERIAMRHPGQQVLSTSSMSAGGLESIRAFLEAGKTYCVLGSSGVGKSTLINGLLGEVLLATQELSEWNQRGKHTTTHRALFVLPSGGVLIDTPGMRELGVVDGAGGVERTFEDIHTLAGNCRFGDCRHRKEPGCAVRAALESGALDPQKLENYEKLLRETAHYEASAAEKRKKARNMGKMHKQIKSEKFGRRF